MAEGAGLENRYMHPHIAGSNPALSAIYTSKLGRRLPTMMSTRLVSPVDDAAAERCQSGLTGTLGKRVWVQIHRRFESCPLRHISHIGILRSISPQVKTVVLT